MIKLGRDGFTPIELVLFIALVGAIGIAGFYAYQISSHHKLATSPINSSPSISPLATPSPTTQHADPYIGWKTYTSQVEHAHFRYPANWMITDQSYRGRDMIELTSPNGSNLVFDTNVSGQGSGGCRSDGLPACVDITVKTIEALPGSSSLFLVATAGDTPLLCILAKNGEIPAKVGNTGVHATDFHPKFKSKDGSRDITFETLRLGDSFEQFKPADAATIRLIMISLAY